MPRPVSDTYKIGDLIEHTNSHRRGRIRTIKECRDGTKEFQVDIDFGTKEFQVDIDFDDIWWNSRHVISCTTEGLP